MNERKLRVDEGTVRIMRHLLTAPPKPHDAMKVGRPTAPKKAAAKRRRRVSSAKQRDA